jgi:hypothetical protein
MWLRGRNIAMTDEANSAESTSRDRLPYPPSFVTDFACFASLRAPQLLQQPAGEYKARDTVSPLQW